MAQVSVTIAGRTYRMACGEGEEEHLHELARTLDARIAAMRTEFGEIGDQRLTVMAAITLADSLSEAQNRIATLERDVVDLTQDQRAQDRQGASMAAAVAAVLDDVTAGLEEITNAVAGQRPPAA